MTEKEILYARISPKNRIYVETLSLKNNQPMSTCIDELITAQRLGRPMKLEKKVPSRQESFERKKKNQKERLQKLKEKYGTRKRKTVSQSATI